MSQDFITIVNEISVDQNMQAKIFLKGRMLEFNDLKWILPFDMKLSRWSQLENLLCRYKDPCHDDHPSVMYFLKKALKSLHEASNVASEKHNRLEDDTSDDNNLFTTHLPIIVDQINLFITNPKRYSPATVIMAFMLYTLSSCA